MNVAQSLGISTALNGDCAPSWQGKLAQRAGPITWAAAGAMSLTLFSLVLAQLDTSILATAADNVSLMLVGIGVVLFTIESLFSALRMHMIADSRHGMLTAMQVTAWHGLWLIALPMRLGEVAWVVSMRRAYGWNLATAVACAGVQRLLDMTIVSACLLLTIPLVAGLHGHRLPAFLGFAGVLCLLALVGSVTLHVWLRLAARLVVGTGRLRGRRRRLLRHLNQGRHWLRSARHRCALRRCIVPTVLSWTAMMTAYWTLGRADCLHITLAESNFAAAGGNLVETLPVQSTGGVCRKQALSVSSHALAGRHGGPDHPVRPLATAGLFWLITVSLTAMPLPSGVAGHSP